MTSAIVFSLAIISCNKEKGKEEEKDTKKLPSKIVLNYDDEADIASFKYDNQNRMTEFLIGWEGDYDQFKLKFEYNANNRLSKVTLDDDGDIFEIPFQYVGNNQIIISSYYGETRLTINANGQIIKEEEEYEYSEDYIGSLVRTWTYVDGNVTKINSIWSGYYYGEEFYEEKTGNVVSSDVLNIFRNATVPDWFLTWFLIPDNGHQIYFPGKNMLSKLGGLPYDEWVYTYQTNSEGYATSCKIIITWGSSKDEYATPARKSLEKPRFKTLSKPRTKAPARKSVETEEINITYEYILAK